MGRKAIVYYTEHFKAQQLHYYQGLPEKAQRHFLAMEQERLGSGSQQYLCTVFSCSHHRINVGKRELSLSRAAGNHIDYSRQRKVGGGRKKKN
jgi:hypothetical protein